MSTMKPVSDDCPDSARVSAGQLRTLLIELHPVCETPQPLSEVWLAAYYSRVRAQIPEAISEAGVTEILSALSYVREVSVGYDSGRPVKGETEKPLYARLGVTKRALAWKKFVEVVARVLLAHQQASSSPWTWPELSLHLHNIYTVAGLRTSSKDEFHKGIAGQLLGEKVVEAYPDWSLVPEWNSAKLEKPKKPKKPKEPKTSKAARAEVLAKVTPQELAATGRYTLLRDPELTIEVLVFTPTAMARSTAREIDKLRGEMSDQLKRLSGLAEMLDVAARKAAKEEAPPSSAASEGTS